MIGHGLIGIKLRRDNKEYIYTKYLTITLHITIQLKKKLYRFNIGSFIQNIAFIFRWHSKNQNHNLLS